MAATITHKWTATGPDGKTAHDYIRIRTESGDTIDTIVTEAKKQQSWKMAGLARQYYAMDETGAPEQPTPIKKGRTA